MALVVRSSTGITRYERAEVEATRLVTAAEDGRRAAGLASELAKNAYLQIDRDSYNGLRGAALSSVMQASALGAFAGVSIRSAELPEVRPDSAHWPKVRWAEALRLCAEAGGLSEAAKDVFYEARAKFEKRELVDEAVKVTLDLQWWLVAAGRLYEAILESEWIRFHLDAMRFDREVVKQWMASLECRRFSSEVMTSVFCKLRGLGRVPSPLAVGDQP